SIVVFIVVLAKHARLAFTPSRRWSSPWTASLGNSRKRPRLSIWHDTLVTPYVHQETPPAIGPSVLGVQASTTHVWFSSAPVALLLFRVYRMTLAPGLHGIISACQPANSSESITQWVGAANTLDSTPSSHLAYVPPPLPAFRIDTLSSRRKVALGTC
ncbi:hypothetical protein BC629DRAFT_1444441, partial [Irpex lacteus]